MMRAIITASTRYRSAVIVVYAVLVAWALWCVPRIALDAVPDLSDTQVIVHARWERSADLIDDQITYPLVTALQGIRGARTVRGISDMGASFVYVIFDDDTPPELARTRVSETLSRVALPPGVVARLGPDASSLGWIFQYVILDRSGILAPHELRALQEWTVKLQLQSVPGVAEVASLGGYLGEYQIEVHPHRLSAMGIPLESVVNAVKMSTGEGGGHGFDQGGRQYLVRGRSYARSPADFEEVPIGVEARSGRSILLREVASVSFGPASRSGVSDFNGEGDLPGGIVIIQPGQNVLEVITHLKEKIAHMRSAIPEGVEIVSTYDRSHLIDRAIRTLVVDLSLEMLIVALVVFLLLRHAPSALIVIITLPVTVLLTFIPLALMGVTTNIMSLAGIAVSIGVLIDGAIVEVENAHRRIEAWNAEGRIEPLAWVRLDALLQVAPPVCFSLLAVAVSFLPVLMLQGQEGRLFLPLAVAKSCTMGIAALLALTLDPALRASLNRVDPFRFRPRWLASCLSGLFVGRYLAEERDPMMSRLRNWYEPVLRWTLRHPYVPASVTLILVVITVPVYLSLGSEYMPPLEEGDLLYMPTSIPGMSLAQARESLQTTGRVIKSFPEVVSVHGKAGRADTATDPAPLSMFETVVTLAPPAAPSWAALLPSALATWCTPSRDVSALIERLNSQLRIPGLPNVWTMPIKNRIDMLSTGIRTPLGIKILGSTPDEVQRTAVDVERSLRRLPGYEDAEVYAERTAATSFIDYTVRREALAAHGLTVGAVHQAVSTALGGMIVGETIDGRARYGVKVRYARDFRGSPESIPELRIDTPRGGSVALEEIAELRPVTGPAMVRNENGFTAAFVYIDPGSHDPGSYVNAARPHLERSLEPLPQGTFLEWSGEYEHMKRAGSRLMLIVPLTGICIALIIFWSTRSAVATAIILTAVPCSLIGAVWMLAILDYHVSTAVWVGMIALLGLDAEMGVFMLMYLELAYAKRGAPSTNAELEEVIVEGAARRLRPKLMTVTAAIAGLLPILCSNGTGSDMMKRIAAPMIGGLVTSFLLELTLYPSLYLLWRGRSVPA